MVPIAYFEVQRVLNTKPISVVEKNYYFLFFSASKTKHGQPLNAFDDIYEYK